MMGLSATSIFGLVLFVAMAAAFAAFWHHVWRSGTPASAIAAACAASAALWLDHAATGRLNANAALLFAALFFVAFVVAFAVQMAGKRYRGK